MMTKKVDVQMIVSSKNTPRAPRQPKLAEDDYVYAMLPTVRGGGVHWNYYPNDKASGGVIARLQRGEVLTAEKLADFPRELQFDPPKSGKIPDIIAMTTGPHIVCPQFRDWLEELEPGRHEFHPIALHSTRKFKGATDHGTYYLIVRPPVINAIIVEGTVFWGGKVGRAGLQPDGSFALSGAENAACYINRKAVEGHHFWYLKGGGDFMFSAELLRRYRAHKFRGLDMSKKCILK